MREDNSDLNETTYDQTNNLDDKDNVLEEDNKSAKRLKTSKAKTEAAASQPVRDEKRMEINRIRAKEIRKRKKEMEEDMHNQIIQLTLENNKLRTQLQLQEAEIKLLRNNMVSYLATKSLQVYRYSITMIGLLTYLSFFFHLSNCCNITINSKPYMFLTLVKTLSEEAHCLPSLVQGCYQLQVLQGQIFSFLIKPHLPVLTLYPVLPVVCFQILTDWLQFLRPLPQRLEWMEVLILTLIL
jgi:hypothetical protein